MVRVRGTTTLASQLRLCAGIAAWSVAAGVMAQESPPPTEPAPAQGAETVETIAVPELATTAEPPPPPEPREATQLEEVVVTSTKRVKALREIPASISVLQGDKLEGQGAQGMEDYLKYVPGVSFAPQDIGFNAVSVRGISGDPYTSQTTGVLFGDISFNDYFKPKVTLDPNPFDLQTVEVLKGPQGTLFGAASLNGAIRYVPEPVNLGITEVKYFAQYTRIAQGSADPVYGGVLNVPFADNTAGVRLMGFARKTPGYVDNSQVGGPDVNSLEQDGLRAMAAFAPGNWQVTAMHARQETDVRSVATTDNADGQLKTDNQPRLSPSHTYYDLSDLGIRHRFDWAEVVSETAKVRTKANSFYDLSRLTSETQPGFGVSVVHDSDTWSQEFRIASIDDAADRWQWTAGVFGVYQEIFDVLGAPVGDPILPAEVVGLLAALPILSNLFTDEGALTLSTGTLDVTVTELALFGEITRRLGDSIELTAGGRLYRTRLSGTATTEMLANDTVLNGDLKEQGFNPKASITWKPSPHLLTYATVSRGYRLGGFQPTPQAVGPKQPPPYFESDQIWNYEAGIRTQWLKRTLRVDLTGFYEQWKNPQLAQADASAVNQWVDNVGGATSKGAEFAAQYRFPIEGLTLSATANFLRTLTTEPFLTATNTQVPTGSEWPYAPKWQTATSLSYAVRLGSWLVNPSVAHTYSSKAWTTLDHYGQVFGASLWDAQLALGNPSIRWLPAITLTVSNLADKRMKTMNRPPASTSPSPYTDVIYVTPRTLTLRLSGQF
jgi:iron complex outermembrane receptor protein